MLVAAIAILVMASPIGIDFVVDRKIAKAQARCAENGRRNATGTIATAESLFEGVPQESLLFQQAAEAVLLRRFQFVEFERKPIPPEIMRSGTGGFYNQFFEDLIGNEAGEKYVRIFVAPATDARCAPFKRFVTFYPNLVVNELRWWGLPPDQCLALERTNELRAAVEHVYVPEISRTHGEPGEWGGWITYRERISKKTLGRAWTGGYYQNRRRYFVCTNKAQLQALDKSMTSSANVNLPPALPITELNDAQFPSSRFGSILSMTHEVPVQSKTAPRKAFSYENWELPGQTLDNGNTFLQPYYERHRMGTSLAGYRIYVVRPDKRHVVPISDRNRSFTHCDFLTRRQSLLFITCNAWKEPASGAKREWGNWLLLYEEGGTPREIIQLDLAGSQLSETMIERVVEIVSLDADSLNAKVHFWKKESDMRARYQADVTFRLTPAD